MTGDNVTPLRRPTPAHDLQGQLDELAQLDVTVPAELAAFAQLDRLLNRRRDLQETIEFGRLQMRQLAESIERTSHQMTEIDVEISCTIAELAS